MDGRQRAEARDAVQASRGGLRLGRERGGSGCCGCFCFCCCRCCCRLSCSPLVKREQLRFFRLVRELARQCEQGPGVAVEDGQRDVVVRVHRRRAPLILHADGLR